MKNSLIILLLFLASLSLYAQEESVAKPKLVIGIVVDQMRYDYLEKFYQYYSQNGFRRLMHEGYNFKNVNYSYKPTYTAPGHASIYTGATPSVHGIIGNNWYSYDEKKVVYCVELTKDSSSIYSPERLAAETISDVIKRECKGKSYGLALKDRGAILPAGKLADGAYWFSSKSGKWESSLYYPESDPIWLKQFNSVDFKANYILNESSFYSNLISQRAKIVAGDAKFNMDSNLLFNHDLMKQFESKGLGLLKAIPQGNQMTADLAKELILAEKLGSDKLTDFLSISFSATDYIGHKYGAESPEVLETYISLDTTISNLLAFLDYEVGEENYILFLSSDHGAGYSREYLKSQNLTNGYLNYKELGSKLDSCLDLKFGSEDWISSFINLNFYFSLDVKQKYKSNFSVILECATNYLASIDGIAATWMPTESDTTSLVKMTKNGYLEGRSGDIILIEKEGWTTYNDKGSTHGSPYEYDTHVPLLFYGNGISSGESVKPYKVIDIIPSVSKLIHVTTPQNSEGKILMELIK